MSPSSSVVIYASSLQMQMHNVYLITFYDTVHESSTNSWRLIIIRLVYTIQVYIVTLKSI